MSIVRLHLFVAGRTPRAEKAIAAVQRLFRGELAHYQYELVVVDVLTDPQQAEDRKILATPTLLKLSPLPQRRIVGDFGDGAGLIAVLDLQSEA